MNYVEQVAKAIRNEVPEDALPESDTDSLFIFYAVLCLTKGSKVSGEDVHDAWSAWMTLRGEQHESLVPYQELPAEVRAEDSPFVVAIRRVAEGGRS
jgi:hypothetical protein